MATICKVSYPQDRTLQSSSQGVSLVPSQVQVDFRDLRQWVVKGEAGRIMKTLTQQLYFPSPAHLFAFAKGNRQTTLEDDQMELKGTQFIECGKELSNIRTTSFDLQYRPA